MLFTNKFNFPEQIVYWLQTDDYDHSKSPNTVSATTLMKPVQAVEIEQRFKDKIVTDVSDLVTSRYGTAIHDSFEKANPPNTIQEVRFYRDFEEFTISGKVDMIRDMDKDVHRITDLKSTSVWTYTKGSRKEDYSLQMSIYKWLCKKGYYIDNLEKKLSRLPIAETADIFYVFTDWSKAEARNKGNSYPQSRVATMTVELLSDEEIEKWISNRLELIRDARKQPLNKLPKCTKEELWQSDTTWAVKKKGGKRATAVAGSSQEAYAIASKKPDYIVEKRDGEARRCDYCLAKPFCLQAQQLQRDGLIT